jgi:phosphonate transport system substrate-binding protein
MQVRLRSYLAPSIPHAFFEHVAGHLGESLGVTIDVSFETRVSGPALGDHEPFAAGEIDVGFVCEPSYRWLATLTPSPVVFAAAPTFDDPRSRERPVYFSDVVVSAASRATGFDELLGATWAYNDLVSKSGYRVLVDRFDGRRRQPVLRHSGSHLASLRMVADGEVDAAAIDSNVLRIAMRTDPALRARLRVVESWGPHAIQPVLLRAALDASHRNRLIDALLRVPAFPDAGFLRFVAHAP